MIGNEVKDVVVFRKNDVQFNCTATGTKIEYKWYHNGAPLKHGTCVRAYFMSNCCVSVGTNLDYSFFDSSIAQ